MPKILDLIVKSFAPKENKVNKLENHKKLERSEEDKNVERL